MVFDGGFRLASVGPSHSTWVFNGGSIRFV